MVKAREEFAADTDPGGEANAGKPVAPSISRGHERQDVPNQTKEQHFYPLVELTLTRCREFVREPEAVFWSFVFPVLLAIALGIAFRNTAPERLRIGVESDGSGTNAAGPNAIADALRGSSDIEVTVLSSAEAAQALRSGKVALVVRATTSKGGGETQPYDSTRTLSSSESGARSPRARFFPSSPLEYRYDPTRPESRMARLAVDDGLQRAMGRADLATARDEKVTEPGARYIDFLVPGLIGMNLMATGMWALGFVIVQARGRKLLKRFAVTPMRRSHYLLSFMLSRLIFMVAEVATVLVFARIIFGVSVRGSLVSVAILSVIGAMTFSGIGLLLAARPKTIEGVSGLMNLVMLPMWLLSGTFFSWARFPQTVQPFIKALPLTALNDSLRAVINDGTPLAASWMQIGIMLAWCLAGFVVALRLFRWE
jgi:ABC-2 type transport system permease protein